MRNKEQERIEDLIAQAKSLSLLTCGNGAKGFEALHKRDQDNILWLLSDLLHQANDLIGGGHE